MSCRVNTIWNLKRTLVGVTRAHANVAHVARFDDIVQGLHLSALVRGFHRYESPQSSQFPQWECHSRNGDLGNEHQRFET